MSLSHHVKKLIEGERRRGMQGVLIRVH